LRECQAGFSRQTGGDGNQSHEGKSIQDEEERSRGDEGETGMRSEGDVGEKICVRCIDGDANRSCPFLLVAESLSSLIGIVND
jgi:hypothetical protein